MLLWQPYFIKDAIKSQLKPRLKEGCYIQEIHAEVAEKQKNGDWEVYVRIKLPYTINNMGWTNGNVIINGKTLKIEKFNIIGGTKDFLNPEKTTHELSEEIDKKYKALFNK